MAAGAGADERGNTLGAGCERVVDCNTAVPRVVVVGELSRFLFS